MHHELGTRSMKSRAKTDARAADRAPKSIRPSAIVRKSVAPAAREAMPPARKSVAPPARKSVAPPARKSVAPQARKSMPPPAGSTGSKKRGRAAKAEPADASGKRRLGMRGAAPWAARHAAKHAEEAAARILALRKNLDDGFFQIGVELKRIQDEKLYEAKGYSSFESFAERELDLGKATAAKLARVPVIFLEAAACHHGIQGVLAAIDALDEHPSAATQKKAAANRANLPLKPPR